tara:strand:- start:3109 stop:4791 length:1683 start_codon:yes stop_codon:yes gene_type:complete
MENSNRKILALKYRPQNFDQLIGQDSIVQTIINSIKLNKIPNAFLLSGIRGVGKTTTARIIAKALNCNKHYDHGEKTSNDKFCHCDEITNSKHLDVLEMDAASKTGVDDVREIIDSSRYKPTIAKYKIYIIDECQMLSRSSWNALLKTLEEPPEQLKFIFCTTEPKKVPVTIISRCQRFDLHRIYTQTLFDHLKKITKLENGKISDEAIKLIAKAGEGSVRDSLSLLDRALISHHINQQEIDEKYVRTMLGIADRSKIIELLKLVIDGDQKKSIIHLKELIDMGLDPANFINDLLEIIYFTLQKKNLGNIDSDLSMSESEVENIESITKDVNITTLIVFWQFIIKTLDELSIVNNQILSLEMLIIRLIHLKDMPSYEKLLDQVDISSFKADKDITGSKEIDISNNEKEVSKVSKEQIRNTIQTKPELTSPNTKNFFEKNLKNISSFEDLIKLASEKKEVELKYDLERNVNLIKFSVGKIDISFNENLSKNFVRNLSEKLHEWTEKRWVITLTKKIGQKTILETKSDNKKKLMDEEKKGEAYKKFKTIFSDAELIEVLKKD